MMAVVVVTRKSRVEEKKEKAEKIEEMKEKKREKGKRMEGRKSFTKFKKKKIWVDSRATSPSRDTTETKCHESSLSLASH